MSIADSPRFPPSVLLFDFGGTLDADGEPWKARFARLFAAEGLRVPAERFDPAFYAVDDALVGSVPATLSLRETAERLAGGVAAALQVTDRALGGRVAGHFADQAARQLGRSAVLLRRLRQRFRLGVVSNFYGNLSAICDEVGIGECLEVAIDSSVVGCTKPDPRIFAHALRHLGVQPAEALFVGDSLPRDMAGARGVGMPHVWLHAPGGGGPGAPCCPRDRVIPCLADLEGLLA